MLAALCMAAGALTLSLPVTHFTLRWQHSIEKIAWEEDYTVAGPWLAITGARIRGSGAGMDPPDNAWLDHGVWHYTLADPWRKEITLARSPYVRDYDLCMRGKCTPLYHWIPVSAGTTTLRACAAQNARP
ncbi:DUF1850 domain-containing protein [Simplicispira hankyongi]|uniref:DUF1850 domain-containing protein n=1 Tax=Simplicispira hankyongi TaxID=2315688 RepID=A0A398C9J4_9BURK|nr:DUF1850 domain-containing protein [Simplicispira hankyongi]RID99034.1 DUF1850 domain-containing protein [Simplicispira hankyongi]